MLMPMCPTVPQYAPPLEHASGLAELKHHRTGGTSLWLVCWGRQDGLGLLGSGSPALAGGCLALGRHACAMQEQAVEGGRQGSGFNCCQCNSEQVSGGLAGCGLPLHRLTRGVGISTPGEGWDEQRGGAEWGGAFTGRAQAFASTAFDCTSHASFCARQTRQCCCC